MIKPSIFANTLRKRIMLLLIGIGVLPLAILGTWTYQQTLEALLTGRKERLVGIRESKKLLIEQFFQKKLNSLSLLSSDDRIQHTLATPVPAGQSTIAGNSFYTWLKKLKNTESYQDIILVGADGVVRFNTRENGLIGESVTRGTMAESDLGQVYTLAMHHPTLLDSLVSRRPMHEAVVHFATPIFRNEQLLGVLILQIAPAQIMEMLEYSQGLGNSGEIFLLGRAHGESALRSSRPMNRGHLGDPFSFPGLDAIFSGMHAMETRLDQTGIPVLTAAVPLSIPGISWVLVVQTSMEEMEQPLHGWTIQFLVFTGSLLLLSIWLAWFLSRRVVTPITMLNHAARSIAEGSWSTRVSVESNDEIGQLSQSFNSMAEAIENHNWIKSMSGNLRDLVNRVETPESLCRSLISELATALGSGQGAIFLQHQADGLYHLTGSYAYLKRKQIDLSFAPGETLIGQCVLEKQPILQTHLPPEYTEIRSGIGKAAPINLLLMPVITADHVVAVIELASFQAITPAHIALLEEITPTFALTLERMRQSQQTALLLDEVQRQSAELMAQQEELVAQNEMLEEKTRDLIHANAELENRQVDLQRARSELADQADRLTLSSRYKSEFLANMSHELRTPLNSILILASTLLENVDNNLTTQQLTSIRILQESGQDLLQLINGVLDLSKIEAGKMEVTVQYAKLREILEDVRQGFTPMAEQKGLKFDVEVADDVPEMVRIDVFKIQQILRNLLANAFKFTVQGRIFLQISHRLSRPEGCLRELPALHGGWLTFTVNDTGIGIQADKQSLIFDAFQQAEGGSNRAHGGTGLGLSISRSLATLLEGTLCVSSIPGHGSSFSLLLPWNQTTVSDNEDSAAVVGKEEGQSECPIKSLAAHKSDNPLAGKRVLVVDDDMRNTYALSHALENHGIRVFMAPNGETALELLQGQSEIDIVLMDVMMPGMDGLETMRIIRAQESFQDLPIIALTAKAMRLDREKALAAGASDYLAKPVDMERLLSLMKVWLYSGKHV
ncbi:MAG: response regulator [Magnetococcales bacterium]|nr:response regulator [Magnetococcales bacterium]MBF0116726.1 response regulator [Magnetococcales bacterium]